MYLLQSFNDILGPALFAFVVYFGIMYNIIISGVKAANKRLVNELRLQNDLKVEEMKKQGFTDVEIQAIIDRVFPKGK